MFASTLLWTLVGVAYCSPVYVGNKPEDEGPQIVKNIATVSADLVMLNSTINSLQVGGNGDLKIGALILVESENVESDLMDTILNANHTTPLNKTESTDIANSVLALEPVIFSVLNNLVEHKPAFASAIFAVGDLSHSVLVSLKTQQKLSNELTAALGRKLAAPYAAAAPIVGAQINQGFSEAIAAYENCTGTICLPPITIPVVL